MKKIKNLILGGILTLILFFCYSFIPKADINSVGSEILNNSTITYYFNIDETSPNTELTTGPGLYINYLDYLNFSVYAQQLNYSSIGELESYILFAYYIYDGNIDSEWVILGVINRTFNSEINSYDYEFGFEYNLPFHSGTDVLFDKNGLNSSSYFLNIYAQYMEQFQLEFSQINLFKGISALMFSENSIVDVEFDPIIDESIPLGSQNAIIKNLFSGLPFTQEEPPQPTYTAQLNYFGNGGYLGENSTSTYTGYIDELESSSLTMTQADVNNIFFNDTEPDLRNGYKFIGWGLSPEDREPFRTVTLTYDGQSRLTGNFYAIWVLDDEIPVNLKLTISNNGIRTELYNSTIFLQNVNGNGGLSNLYFNKNGTFFRFNIGASLRKMSNILNYDYINYASYYFNEENSQGYTDFTTNIISNTVNDVIINIYNVNSNGQIINKYYEASDNNEWDEQNLFSVIVDNIQPEGEISITIYINADLPSEETNFKSWVSSIAEIFSIILAINIGFITIGQFVFLVLAIFVIIFIIRMVRGGKGG